MMIHLESVQEAVDAEAPMFLLTKHNFKFLGLRSVRTFLLLLLRSFLCISPVSCEFRDFEDAVDGVHAINEPRDRHLSLGPLAVAGPPGRGRGPEDDEKDNGGHL